jgi:hypothetical protein
MIPSKLDLTIYRGTTFELELVSQIKKYIYDPAIHTGASDLKRSHAENLEYHGFTYEYVNFSSIYDSASLLIMKPWEQSGDEARQPLMTLNTTNGRISLTTTSVKLGISAADTQEIDFDSGSYKLLLVTAAGKTDGLIHGMVTIEGER